MPPMERPKPDTVSVCMYIIEGRRRKEGSDGPLYLWLPLERLGETPVAAEDHQAARCMRDEALRLCKKA